MLPTNLTTKNESLLAMVSAFSSLGIFPCPHFFRSRFEKKLQDTKAQAAADVEAARKKALDDVRDYRQRLDILSEFCSLTTTPIPIQR